MSEQSASAGSPDASNPAYVQWLIDQSMLANAAAMARRRSPDWWLRPFARPNPDAAIGTADVWFTTYPASLVPEEGKSFLGTLADPVLWETFQRIGINGLHTGPVKRAGGLNGWEATPTVDGHFDRSGTAIDADFGTEDEFRLLCAVAAEYDGAVIDDLVPAHTGKGADWRLAEMNVGDYPGLYHMVEIPESQWQLLPEVPAGEDAANLSVAQEAALSEAGLIIGPLQRVIFFEPGVKETNWSATAPVLGVDGVTRRWVYLHYFKMGQPSLQWLDPSFAGGRLVVGDAVHSMTQLGSRGLRLDANGFLGLERSATGGPAWSEGHPLSEAANQLIASQVRALGGFTFQELNLTIDNIRSLSRSGADLSYDFITRPAYHHALATQNTEFLRLTLREASRHGVAPKTLVHALQNHDELTYELLHFATRHHEDQFEYAGGWVSGSDLAEWIRSDLLAVLTGPAAPYNLVFTTNGIASTTVSVVAAALGICDLDGVDEEHLVLIREGHLLLAMYNALQPGVFALSGWDLCGVLPLDPSEVAELLADGDTRWINRGAYDLIGGCEKGHAQLPLGRSLYGDLASQLADPSSFASRLTDIIRVRRECGLARADQLDVPEVSHPSVLMLVHRLPDGRIQITMLNFAPEEAVAAAHSQYLPPGAELVDLFDHRVVGAIDPDGRISVGLAPFGCRAFVLGGRGA